MATKPICSIDGCDKSAKARGWCGAHWFRWRHHGHPLGKAKPYGKIIPWIHAHADYKGSDCLVWPFARLPDGYACTKLDGVSMKASRAMCIIAHGQPPSSRHQAAHSCGKGNDGCVNPNHLRWATPEENQADKLIHGTHNRGTRHGNSKLNEDDIREIRLLEGRVSHRGIAAQFDVTHSQIQKILNRKVWGWLK